VQEAVEDGGGDGGVVEDVAPVGDVHAPIWDYEDGSRLRLHLWPSEPFRPQYPAWPVHQHAWPLTSFVVRGQIRDERFMVQEDSSGDRCVYTTTYADGRSVLHTAERRVVCEPLGSTVWQRAHSYVVPLGVYHASRAEGASVTLAESGVPTGDPPLVVGMHGALPVVTYERRPLTASELAAVLDEVRHC